MSKIMDALDYDLYLSNPKSRHVTMPFIRHRFAEAYHQYRKDNERCRTCKHWEGTTKSTYAMCVEYEQTKRENESCQEWQEREG